MTADSGDKPFLANFEDPEAVAAYADGPRRFVPGLDALHRMTGVLLAERAPPDARVLVLGAGGGLELKALADSHPGWTFTGVDPAGPMLRLAERTLGPLSERVELVKGYIEDAPEGPYDAAVCLLTLHFLDPEERRRTAGEIRRRLRTGAPFVAAHSSFPQDPAAREVWLGRYAAYAVASGVEPDKAYGARDSVRAALDLLDPDADEAVLRAAGFRDVAMFYAAFTWRGWVGYA
ncbi:class I SAM-dependent methyltransferase [Phenylobacterium sp. SCN 70-31]|uniref:class I SAM-dependent methyltransferase n=1 Tax=Phenylobacterium sp. SCN 70-31 TaxID=1660129 RepID=UPI00086C635A|nr:class I SAM-dependent methyltransferase [Phenylobacterium sp. SCN 70-31]ODT87298.1 MAG: methyltransferase [Phenylobacterium sp. SCN 70-31]